LQVEVNLEQFNSIIQYPKNFDNSSFNFGWFLDTYNYIEIDTEWNRTLIKVIKIGEKKWKKNQVKNNNSRKNERRKIKILLKRKRKANRKKFNMEE
jgi:hypothetical protein